MIFVFGTCGVAAMQILIWTILCGERGVRAFTNPYCRTPIYILRGSGAPEDGLLPLNGRFFRCPPTSGIRSPGRISVFSVASQLPAP